MENLALDLEELFTEISERARESGALTREEWDDIVDELLEEKREVGEMHDDDDRQQMVEALKSRFNDFEVETEEM